MNEIKALYERHSVRNYKAERIEEETVALIRQKIDELNRESGLHLQYIEDAGKTYNKLLNRTSGLNSAPSVIACVGRESDSNLEEKVGYYGEKLVLEAQIMGLNTCWVGLSYKKIGSALKIGDDEKLVCVIAVGYGETQGATHKIKSPNQVSATPMENAPDWYKNGIECALLAPTAINQQKFKFSLDGNMVGVKAGLGFYSKVDMGIVKYHFELGAGIENFIWK